MMVHMDWIILTVSFVSNIIGVAGIYLTIS
jgi:hypothetical protein